LASSKAAPHSRNRQKEAEGGLQAELPRTAIEVLEAAKRIVAERGIEAVTLDAVAEESGNYRSAIRYHFGDKAGLISAVMDSTALTTVTTPLFATAMGVQQGRERIEAHLAALEAVSTNREQGRLFWSLVPQILSDTDLRHRLDALYDRYRRINIEALGVEARTPQDERRLLGLASLLTAVCDGLSLLASLSDEVGPDAECAPAPKAEIIHAAYEVLGELLETYVPTMTEQQSRSDGGPEDSGTSYPRTPR